MLKSPIHLPGLSNTLHFPNAMSQAKAALRLVVSGHRSKFGLLLPVAFIKARTRRTTISLLKLRENFRFYP